MHILLEGRKGNTCNRLRYSKSLTKQHFFLRHQLTTYLGGDGTCFLYRNGKKVLLYDYISTKNIIKNILFDEKGVSLQCQTIKDDTLHTTPPSAAMD